MRWITLVLFSLALVSAQTRVAMAQSGRGYSDYCPAGALAGLPPGEFRGEFEVSAVVRATSAQTELRWNVSLRGTLEVVTVMEAGRATLVPRGQVTRTVRGSAQAGGGGSGAMDSTRQAQLRHSNTDGADLILVGELSAVTGRSSATYQGASGSVAIGAGSSAGREIRIGFNLDERSCGRVAGTFTSAHWEAALAFYRDRGMSVEAQPARWWMESANRARLDAELAWVRETLRAPTPSTIDARRSRQARWRQVTDRVARGSWTAHERACVLEPWYLDVRDRAAQWLAEDSARLRSSNSVEIFMERSSRVLALARILSDVSVEACTIDVVQAGLAAINAAAQRLMILMMAEGRSANLLAFTQRMQLVGDVSPALAEAAWAQIRADALRNFTQARGTFDAAAREPRERRLLLHRRLSTAFSQAEAMSVEVPLTRAGLEALRPR
jgi:hypothetical protein